VLAHGFGGSARNFRPQARAFADRRSVWLYDARGHARSPAPRAQGAYATAELVADFAAVVADAGPLAVAGGLSLGAYTALAFALSSPAPPRGLVLAAFPSPGSDPARSRWAHEFADSIEREGLEAAGQRYVWGEASRFDAKAAALIRQGFLEHDPAAMTAILREVLATIPAPQALAAELRALSVPVLVIVGALDAESLAPSRALCELLPNAELVVVPEAGHVVNLAAPQAFNAALAAFLTRVG
jgi:pimeloyl-ACP methyl ester carboxylesterase